MATNNKLLNCPHLRFPEFKDEWKQTTLGEVATFCGGGTPSSQDSSYWDGNIPWISSSDIQSGNISHINITRFISLNALKHSSTKLCKAPCIVIVSRVGVGKVAYSEIDICTSQDFCNLTDIQAEYHFLAYLLQPLMERKSVEVQGTSIKGITMDEIKHIAVSLPSLAEQKKIASFLSLLDERIEAQRQTIKERKNQKKALLSQIFSQALRFPGFSDEWTPCIIRDFGEVITGGTPPTLDSLNYNPPKYLWASPSDLGNAKYLLKTKKLISEKGLSIVRSLPKGSILVTCIGLIGKMGIATEEMASNQQINAVIVSDAFSNEYVYYAIYSKAYSFQTMASAQVVPILSKREFERLPNSYPSLPEQERIANFLSLIDERIEMEEQLLRKYEEQKRYLLRKMFV